MMWDYDSAIVLITTLVRSIRTMCNKTPCKKRPRGWARPVQADRFKLTNRGHNSRGGGRNSHAVARNTPVPGGNRWAVARTPAPAGNKPVAAVVRCKPAPALHRLAAERHKPAGCC